VGLSKLFDPILAPFRRQRVSPTEQVGVPGTVVLGGYVQPIETSGELVGQRKYKTFANTLVNVSIVAAGTRYFLNLCAKAGWKVEPAEDGGPAAEEVAEFIDDVLQSMSTPWYRTVRRAAMYRFYGFSVQEWTARRREDGRIGLLDVASRPQITIERWDVDEHGAVAGVVQRSPQTGQEIYLPRTKIVYAVDDSLSDSPEGIGLLRHVAEPARRLARYEQLEGYGFETDLRGMPVGRAPLAELERRVKSGEMSQEQADAQALVLKNFIENHIRSPQLGLVLDSLTYATIDEKSTPSPVKQWDLELLKAGVTSQEAVASAIQRVNREIARILGVENILLGEHGAGSLAMARDKSDTFALIVDSTLRELRETFKKDVMETVLTLNGIPQELWPELKTESLQHRDITEVTGALREMAEAGAILPPDDPAINEVRDLLGLSRQEMTDAMRDGSLVPPEPPEPEPEDLKEEEPAE